MNPIVVSHSDSFLVGTNWQPSVILPEHICVARINSLMGALSFIFSFVYSLQEGFSTPLFHYCILDTSMVLLLLLICGLL